MWSGLPRYIPLGAHSSGQVLMFEGITCSHFRAFTSIQISYQNLQLVPVWVQQSENGLHFGDSVLLDDSANERKTVFATGKNIVVEDA